MRNMPETRNDCPTISRTTCRALLQSPFEELSAPADCSISLAQRAAPHVFVKANRIPATGIISKSTPATPNLGWEQLASLSFPRRHCKIHTQCRLLFAPLCISLAAFGPCSAIQISTVSYHIRCTSHSYANTWRESSEHSPSAENI